jgi:Tat protein secretion system quality control protein TatD with DNase activity
MAFEDIESILHKETKGDLIGVMHCFSGDIEFARKLLPQVRSPSNILKA